MKLLEKLKEIEKYGRTKKNQPTSHQLTEEEIAQKTWDSIHWLQYGNQLHKRKMAELRSGLYDPTPYEWMEKIVFVMAVLGLIVFWLVCGFLIFIGQYIYGVAAMVPTLRYMYFLITLYNRAPMRIEATKDPIKIDKPQGK